MGWGRDRGLRSSPPGPEKIFGDTFGPLPFGSTPSLPTPRGCPICPPSLSWSSVSRRVITALFSFAQGDAARICFASSSVHSAAGLLFQTGSAAMRLDLVRFELRELNRESAFPTQFQCNGLGKRPGAAVIASGAREDI